MKTFIKILSREFIRFIKSKDLVLICLIAPFIYSFGLTYIYNKQNPKNIKLAIVDQDNHSVSRQYERMLDSTPELNISNYYPSSYAAYDAIFKNKADVFYFIPRDFSSNLKRGNQTFAFIGSNACNFIVSSTSIKTIVATSQFLSAKVFVKFLIGKGISKQTATQMVQPMKGDFRWLFNPTKTYANFFIPFLLLAVFQQILIVGVCHTMSLETQENTWKDLFKITDNNILPIILGKAIPYIIVASFMSLMFIFLVFPFSSITIPSKLILIFLIFIYSLVIVFFAMAISHLFKTPVMSLCALTFYSMPVLLISGFAWPLYMLPWYLKISAFIFPSTYFINTFRFYCLQELDIVYATIPIIHLVIFMGICIFINYIVLKLKAKKADK